MLLPWNMKPQRPAVAVRRIIPAMDDPKGVTCLEARAASAGCGSSSGLAGPGWCLRAAQPVASLGQPRVAFWRTTGELVLDPEEGGKLFLYGATKSS